MKKRISKDIIFLSINLLLIIIVGIYAITKDKTEYILNLPSVHDIKNIELVKDETTILIEDEETLKEIIELLNNKTTKEASIQDYPGRTSELYKMYFNYKENGAAFLYIYKRRNNYYAESPYEGIYKLSKKEYNQITSHK